MEVKNELEKNGNVDKKIRLNRFLAQCGLGSRRECDKLIEAGHIYCNGKKVTTLGIKIDPEKDKIEYRGKEIKIIRQLEYLVYYKPREVIVSTIDPEGRKTIYEDLESRGKDIKHLKYVGGLDYHAEGLLLLTNDGSLIHALTHPRYKIKQVYYVKAQRLLTTEEIKKLLSGVESEGEVIYADEIKLLTPISEDRKQYWYEIVIYQNKNRQIRRLFEAINVNISRLKRVQFAHLKLGELKGGEIRSLTKKEIEAMKNIGYRRGN